MFHHAVLFERHPEIDNRLFPVHSTKAIIGALSLHENPLTLDHLALHPENYCTMAASSPGDLGTPRNMPSTELFFLHSCRTYTSPQLSTFAYTVETYLDNAQIPMTLPRSLIAKYTLRAWFPLRLFCLSAFTHPRKFHFSLKPPDKVGQASQCRDVEYRYDKLPFSSYFALVDSTLRNTSLKAERPMIQFLSNKSLLSTPSTFRLVA